MSDNYAEETQPLFKLLRTEAFRFVLVHYNHYSLLRQLKAEVNQQFSHRAIVEIDAKANTYRQIADAYYQLGKGIFFIDNFESVLQDPEKYIGLNLHRDKMASQPIAMICFISPGAQQLSAKEIMEKMPDLWSFRSLMLDLQTDISAEIFRDRNPEIATTFSSLGGYTQADKLQELERLQKLVAETPESEKSLLETFYRQIKDIQTDLGYYEGALKTISILKTFVNDNEDLGRLHIEEGDLLRKSGKYNEVLVAYNKALELFFADNSDDKSNLGVVYERLGNLYTDLGDIENGLSFFEKYHETEMVLLKKNPQNENYKFNLGVAHSRLGETQATLGEFDKAKMHFEARLKLSEELYYNHPQNDKFKLSLAIAYGNIGIIQHAINEFENAIVYFDKALTLFEELYQDNPRNIDYKQGLMITYSRLGNANTVLGNFDRALIIFEKVFVLSKELYNLYPESISFKNSLAIAYSHLGNLNKVHFKDSEKAHSHFLNAQKIWQELNTTAPRNAEFQKNLNWVNDALKEME